MPDLSIGTGFSPFNQKNNIHSASAKPYNVKPQRYLEFNTIFNIIGFSVKLIKQKAPGNFPGLFY